MRPTNRAAQKRHAAAISATMVLASLGVLGCGTTAEDFGGGSAVNGGSANGPVGVAELALVTPSGSKLDKVSYKITRKDEIVMTGDIPVDSSTEIKFQIGAIPAKDGYKMKLAAATSTGLSCEGGPAPFDIMAGKTSLLQMKLKCGGESKKKGNVRVDVEFEEGSGNGCAEVDGMTVVPRSVNVGGSMILRGYSNSTSATYAWTVAPTSAGTFSAASDDETNFTCATEGTHTVTLSVNGGGSCPASTSDVPVICTAGDGGAVAGTGGEGGAGAGGEGGAGAGGEGGAGAGGEGGAGAGGEGGAGAGGEGGAGAGGEGGAGAGGEGGAGAGGAGAGGEGGAGAGGAGAGGEGGAGAGGSGGGGASPDGSSAACATCRQTNCTDYQGSGLDLVSGCFTAINTSLGAPAGDPNFLQECIDFVVCARTNKCGFTASGAADCYCGSATPDNCINNGPAADSKCLAATQAAARSTVNADISLRFTDLAYPLGWAYFLVECDTTLCMTDCVPQ